MAICYDEWKVLKHRPIERVSPNLWRVEGVMESGTKRIMSLVRLEDGRVLMHNPVALEAAEMAEIEAWGEVAGIVVPNAFHRMDSKIMQARYPKARVYCPGNATKAVNKATPVHGSLADAPGDATVRVRHLEGIKENEGVIEVQTPAGLVVVFNDMLLNVPKAGFPMELFIGPSGAPAIPRFARWFFVKDKAALRADLEGLLARDPRRLVPGHGADVTEDTGERLRAAIALL
jgi:hypothetical protein